MTIQRVYLAGWGIGEKLTSAQQNQLDLNTTYALDKRSGQTDTLASVVSCSGAGRIIHTYAAGADANTTYLVSGANSTIDVSTLTADREYTLSNTNASAGDVISILNRSNYYVTVKNGAGTTIIQLGSTIGSAIDGTDAGEDVWCDALFNGSAWVVFRSGRPTSLGIATYLADGTYIVPRGITAIRYIGCGGGGGGGGGGPAAGSDRADSAGGGGGGAVERTGVLIVTPGETLNITVADGGAGGAAANAGANGEDSLIVRATGSVTLATLMGAEGGAAGTSDNGAASATPLDPDDSPSTPIYRISSGGSPVRRSSGSAAGQWRTFDSYGRQNTTPQAGGWGYSRSDPGLSGNGSPQGYLGGSGGSSGADSSAYFGGGGGGGGGAGPYGNGAAGGAGGAANNSGAATNGSAGSSAAANSGGGGGGGGASGASSTLAGSGGAGGAGGSGRIVILPLR